MRTRINISHATPDEIKNLTTALQRVTYLDAFDDDERHPRVWVHDSGDMGWESPSITRQRAADLLREFDRLEAGLFDAGTKSMAALNGEAATAIETAREASKQAHPSMLFRGDEDDVPTNDDDALILARYTVEHRADLTPERWALNLETREEGTYEWDVTQISTHPTKDEAQAQARELSALLGVAVGDTVGETFAAQ